jgi:SAM-dependent methyltransferase
MPEAAWYEEMYQGRDGVLLPLEPGHKYFLADRKAPGHGELLDVGCGTGNFLAAARAAGYAVMGTELDGKAATFAREKLGIERILPLSIEQFHAENPAQRHDVITFFEVLEHQADPRSFLQSVKASLRDRGTIALSVPNRDRWQTGPDVLDYPPNHFLRWNAGALDGFLSTNGFEILSLREQPATLEQAAQMINMALRTGMIAAVEQGQATSFRDLMQMPVQEAKAAMGRQPTARQRVMRALGRMKHGACYPLAAVAMPYVWLRGYKGTYLYCLARLRV